MMTTLYNSMWVSWLLGLEGIPMRVVLGGSAALICTVCLWYGPLRARAGGAVAGGESGVLWSNASDVERHLKRVDVCSLDVVIFQGYELASDFSNNPKERDKQKQK
ncbi:hypothetical protein Tco_1419555 [Tanacetum coccineum]